MLGSSSTTATVVTRLCIERSVEIASEIERTHRALHRGRKNAGVDLSLWEGATRIRATYDYVAGLEAFCFV